MDFKPPVGTKPSLSHPLMKGLIGWWLFNEGAGIKAFDSSSYNNTGALTGIANPASSTSGWGARQSGKTVLFNGSTDYVQLTDAVYLHVPKITLLATIRTASTPNAANCVYDGSGSGTGYSLYLNSSGQAVMSINGGLAIATGTTVLTNDKEYRIAGTYDLANIRVYVNGRQEAATPYSTAIDYTSIRALIGRLLNSSFSFTGSISDVRVYGDAWTAQRAWEDNNNKFPMFERKKRYFAGPVGITFIAVGQASETDLAQAMAWQVRRLVGQATETDLAQGITWRLMRLVGQVSEADLAQGIAWQVSRLIDQASETDTAQTMSWAPRHRLVGQATEVDVSQSVVWAPMHRLVGQVVETDLAQSITWRLMRLTGQASEADLAQGIAWQVRRLVGLVSETDLSQAMAISQGADIVPVGQASEADLAQGIAWQVRRLIANASETDLAQVVSWAPQHRLLLLVSETDLAQAMAASQGAEVVAVVQASEVDLAQSFAWVRRRLVAQASEVDLAQALLWAPKHRLVALANESDLAQSIAWQARRLLGQVGETDLAQAIAAMLVHTVGQASETNLAQSVLWAPRFRFVGQASETDLAQAILVALVGSRIAIFGTWTLTPVITGTFILNEP